MAVWYLIDDRFKALFYKPAMKTNISELSEFSTLFTKQSLAYSTFRPSYPNELFKYLKSITPGHQLAWDCATGTGQAAIKLVNYFDYVIATDISESQIKNGYQHKNISYKVSYAEKTEIESHAVDLVAAAQCLHWFVLPQFYEEVRRVSKPNGVIAAWGYGYARIESKIDDIVTQWGREFLKPYWGSRMTSFDYNTAQFPFRKIDPPKFKMVADWNLKELLGYLDSWSGVQTYKDKNNTNPIDAILKDLVQHWESPEGKKRVSWDIDLLVGRLA